MKKNVAGAIPIIAAVIILLFIRKYLKDRSEQERLENQTKVEMIKDSLIHLSQQEELHRDSAQFYHEEHDKTYQHYLTAMADTCAWADLRAKYRSDLRAKIRAGSTGHSDSLRAVKAGRF